MGARVSMTYAFLLRFLRCTAFVSCGCLGSFASAQTLGERVDAWAADTYTEWTVSNVLEYTSPPSPFAPIAAPIRAAGLLALPLTALADTSTRSGEVVRWAIGKESPLLPPSEPEEPPSNGSEESGNEDMDDADIAALVEELVPTAPCDAGAGYNSPEAAQAACRGDMRAAQFAENCYNRPNHTRVGYADCIGDRGLRRYSEADAKCAPLSAKDRGAYTRCMIDEGLFAEAICEVFDEGTLACPHRVVRFDC